ncbi:TldD/PmbA family protein [Myxococcota bacterium]|nr:TldD/PmbA family protein [Myxococcota bacterium]
MKPSTDQKLISMGNKVLELSKRAGAGECAVSITKRTGNRVVNRDGKWEEIKGSTTFSIKIRLFVDNRYAVHVTSDGRTASLESFIREATALTRYLAQDKHRHLPDPTLYNGRSKKDLGLYDPKILALSLSARKEVAEKAFASARSHAGPKLISCAATFGDSVAEHVLLTSNGFSDSEVVSTVYNYATVSLKDSDEGRPSDYEYTASRTINGLLSPEAIGKMASERTIARLGAKKIPSGKMDVIVENRALGSLLSGFLRPLEGNNVYNKQSCMADLRGKSLGSSLLTLQVDPLIVGGLGSSRFDGEGLTARQFPLLDKGVLRNFFIDVYYGSKLGEKPTSGNHFNLLIQPGSISAGDLLKRVKKGILVTSFNGGNSNSTSGDFSHGVSGFLIERGSITSPVKELNIAGNHKDFWKKAAAVGNDLYLPSSVRTPSLLFPSVMIAGT